ncbi:MAG: S-layer homology domain-containing protein, partial [Firmicutes bacterium]|nr:S-layer homology domain-containing protein [Bacillota bacterium]
LTTVDGITVLQHCTWSSGSVTFKRTFEGEVDWSLHAYENIKIVAYVYIDIEGEESDDIYSDGLVSKGKFEIRQDDSTNRYYWVIENGDIVLHTGWNAIEVSLSDVELSKAADGATADSAYENASEFCFYLTCNGHELTMSLAYAYIIDTSYDNTETTDEIPYTDVSSTQWFYESVVWAYKSGLMVGKTADTFAPDDTMTRAEFVTVLYRLENGEAEYTAEKENPFTDVSSAQWFYKYVMWAYDKGIINGTSDTTFDPDGSITREQIALILYRRYGAETECDLSVYPDANEISTYSDEPAAAMQWAVSVGLIKGNEDGTLDPQGNATRAQVATIYMRFVGE